VYNRLMSVQVNIKHDLDKLAKNFKAVYEKQIPFVLSSTMNKSMFETMKYTRKQYGRYLDNPVAFTRRGVLVNKSTKKKLHGQVYIPADQWKYLKWMIKGGTKTWNLSRTGIIVPTSNMRLNKHGNIVGKKRRADLWRYGHASANNEFVVLPKSKSKLHPGVYKRGKFSKGRSNKIQMIATFESTVRYKKKQMPFDRIVIKNFSKEFKMRLHKTFLRVIKQEMARRNK